MDFYRGFRVAKKKRPQVSLTTCYTWNDPSFLNLQGASSLSPSIVFEFHLEPGIIGVSENSKVLYIP